MKKPWVTAMLDLHLALWGFPGKTSQGAKGRSAQQLPTGGP